MFTMRLGSLLLLVLSFSTVAEDLIVRHHIESEDYILGLIDSCLKIANEKGANTVADNGLPVKEIDQLAVTMPFVLNRVSVSFSSSQNITHYVYSLRCSFDRFTGELRSFVSLNPHTRESDIIENTMPEIPKRYARESEDEMGKELFKLGFGFELSYENYLTKYRSRSKSAQ